MEKLDRAYTNGNCQYTDAETVKVVNDKDTVTVCDTSIYRVCHYIEYILQNAVQM